VRIQSRHECELLVVRRLKEYLLKTVPGEGRARVELGIKE